MMSLSHIQSVVARCLMDPDFLDSLRSNPRAALKSYELDPHAVSQIVAADLNKIRWFAGFISKIQHNHLWQLFPATRALLAYYKIELDVFAAYRGIQLSPEVRQSDRDGRIAHFLEFVKDYGSRKGFPALRVAAIHEQNLWELGKIAYQKRHLAPIHSLSSLSWSDLLRLIPRPNPTLRVISFPSDPGKLVECICAGHFQGKLPRRSVHWIAYVKDPRTARVRFLELNVFSTLMLSRMDGRHTIKSIMVGLGKDLREVPQAGLTNFIRLSQECGVISLICRKEETCASSL
jgi:hypothetical protein